MARALLDINVIMALLDQGPAHLSQPPAGGSGGRTSGRGLLQTGLIRWERLLGPRQVTDAYLLPLAVHHGGRFVTFDQRIATDVVAAAGLARRPSRVPWKNVTGPGEARSQTGALTWPDHECRTAAAPFSRA